MGDGGRVPACHDDMRGMTWDGETLFKVVFYRYLSQEEQQTGLGTNDLSSVHIASGLSATSSPGSCQTCQRRGHVQNMMQSLVGCPENLCVMGTETPSSVSGPGNQVHTRSTGSE